MIYIWCTSCNGRNCTSENSHRVQRMLQYRADFMLGGRYGKRIRKLFSNKKDAESFEYVTLADFKRGTFLPQDNSKILFKEFFKEYNKRKIQNYMKGKSVEVYRLSSFLDQYQNRPLNTFRLSDWDNYVYQRIEQNISQTTLNRDLTSIKTMFKWAVNNNYLKNNPFEKAKKFKVENIRIRWLNEREIETILTECTKQDDLDLRDILEFALNTGFRKGNLIRVTAIDILNNRIQASRTKSNKPYDVPISNQLAILLKRLNHKTGPLLNFKNFRKRFNLVIKDSSITLHTFRHTFAAQCLKKGIPIDRVCKWLGHHSVEFTRTHYGHLCPNQEQIEINLLNLGVKKDCPQPESNWSLSAENRLS